MCEENALVAAAVSFDKQEIMAHAIGRSIREVVRQYREELSCQNASNDVPLCFDASSARKFLKCEEVDCEKRASSPKNERHVGTKKLKDKRHVCWHDSLTGTMQEKTGTCTPRRFGTDDLGDFQDLDRRATEVLRRSQQVIEGGQACKSSGALISKSGHHVDYIQKPSYFVGGGHSSSGTAERRSHKNHCRARDVVARNFEEIDQILGESNLVMEQSSSSDIQHKASDYNKVGKEIRQACKELGFEPGHGPYGDELPYPGAEHSKQDMEVREEAAIKAANHYLNKGNGHSSVRSERLLELASTCLRSLNASDGSVGSADQACHPSTFNINKQQEKQTTMSLPFPTLESCQGTKIYDQSVLTTSSVTPTIQSEIKWPKNAESDGQWLNNSRQLDSETVDFASMVESKGVWKYAEEINYGEGHLGSTKSLELDAGLPMSSRNSATTTTRQRPSTVDTEQFPFSTKEKLTLETRDICSIQMPVSHATCFGEDLGAHARDVPFSENRSCTGRLVRRASHGSLCLEDDMRQLSTEDLLLALEKPIKIRASLKPSSPKDQFGDSCEGQRTYQPEQYLSPGKCSTSSTATEFERLVTSHHFNMQSSFAGGLDGKDDDSTTYSAILASFEEDGGEGFYRTSPQASGSHRYLQKSNPVERSKGRHSDPATQLLCSSAKYRGIKDKDESPAWMHSLNVRKPTKWRAMSITHTRLQASAASLIKGTVVVEELEELALRHNRPKETILAAAVNSYCKGRAQEDFNCRATTARIPKHNSVIDYSRQAGNHIPASVYTKIIETRNADDDQTSHVFSQVGKRIANGAAPIAGITTSSEQAHEISLPRVLTVLENHCVTNSLVAHEDSRFDNLPRNSAFSSELDYLISEVVHEWVEICSTLSPTFPAYDGSQELRTTSPLTTCSITEEVSTTCPVSEDGSSPEEIMKGMQVSEAGKWSANQDHFRKLQGSKSWRARDSDLVKDVRKTSVAALASVVQPLLAALQEAQIEESIVTEFEADETVRLLLEKLQFYEAKIRALKSRRKSKNLGSAED